MMATPPDVTGPINIGNPREFTIRELAELIIEMTGAKSRLRFEPLPSDDPRQRQPDISMAKSVLKWEPKIPLREGLTKTIAYFETVLRQGGERKRRIRPGVSGRAADRRHGAGYSLSPGASRRRAISWATARSESFSFHQASDLRCRPSRRSGSARSALTTPSRSPQSSICMAGEPA